MWAKRKSLFVFGLFLVTFTGCISARQRQRQRSIDEFAGIIGTAKELIQRLRGPPKKLRPSAKNWIDFRSRLVQIRNSLRFQRTFAPEEKKFIHYLIAYTAIMIGNYNCSPMNLKSYICTTKFPKMIIGLSWCQEAIRNLPKTSKIQEHDPLYKIMHSARSCVLQMRANIACYKLKECGIRCRKLFLRFCPFCPTRFITNTNYTYQKPRRDEPSL